MTFPLLIRLNQFQIPPYPPFLALRSLVPFCIRRLRDLARTRLGTLLNSIIPIALPWMDKTET